MRYVIFGHWKYYIHKKEENEMKKIVAILAVLVLVFGCAFAADGDYVEIKAKVPARDPNYSLKAGLTDNTLAAVTANTLAGGTLNTQIDISTQDIYVYVEIFHTRAANNATIKPTKNAEFNVTLTADPLKHKSIADSKTADPTVVKSTPATSTTNYTVTDGDLNTNSIIYTVKYDGKVVAENSPVANCVIKWAAKDELEVASGDDYYSANITLTYTTK